MQKKFETIRTASQLIDACQAVLATRCGCDWSKELTESHHDLPAFLKAFNHNKATTIRVLQYIYNGALLSDENISLRVVCKEPLESRTVPEPFRVGGVDVRAMQPLNPTTEAETMKTNAENRH